MADLNNHRNAALGQRHAIHNWEFDNAALREAESIPPADSLNVSNLKKWALQLDDNSLWMLIDAVEDTENPGAYIPTWKSVGGGGNSRAGYTYFGLRCNSVVYPGNSATLSEAQFFTSSGLLLPLFATTGTTVGLFNGSAPDLTLPFVLYTQSNTVYTNHLDIRLEDIDAFRIFTNYGEYGAFNEFDLIASQDGESWVTIRSYVNHYIQGGWQTFNIKQSSVYIATLQSNTASQENGTQYTNFTCTPVTASDVASWEEPPNSLILWQIGIYKIKVHAQVVPVDSYYIIQNGRQETVVSGALLNFRKTTHTSSDSDSNSPYTPEQVITWCDDFIVDNSAAGTEVGISLAFKNGYTGYSGINYRALIVVELL